MSSLIHNIRRLAEEGYCKKEISRMLDIKETTLGGICRRNGIECVKKAGRPEGSFDSRPRHRSCKSKKDLKNKKPNPKIHVTFRELKGLKEKTKENIKFGGYDPDIDKLTKEDESEYDFINTRGNKDFKKLIKDILEIKI